jgi:hypothetical protein
MYAITYKQQYCIVKTVIIFQIQNCPNQIIEDQIKQREGGREINSMHITEELPNGRNVGCPKSGLSW